VNTSSPIALNQLDLPSCHLPAVLISPARQLRGKLAGPMQPVQGPTSTLQVWCLPLSQLRFPFCTHSCEQRVQSSCGMSTARGFPDVCQEYFRHKVPTWSWWLTEVPSSRIFYDCIIMMYILIYFLPHMKEEMLLYSFCNTIWW